ncbi:MAG: hypothetical protein H7Y32_09860, partial [Chloroflexales bacterium]|nr:hypothetical protein [Chloroflexales bacterium]
FRVSETQIDVYADTARQIGMIDPLLREMYTGVGCALENLMLAATTQGFTARITYMPDPADSTYAARITLAPAAPAGNPLYDAIPRRRTNRLAYDVTRPVPAELIAQLDALNDDPDVRLIWVTDPSQRAAIGENIIAATEALNADDEQSIASHEWWRGNWGVLQSRADGLTPDAGQTAAFAQLIKMLPDADRATSDAAFLDQTRTRHVATAMGYGFITVRDPMDNALRLRSGRLWQRIHLQATIQGLGMQPLNQMPERADREAQLGLQPRFTQVLAAIVGDPAFRVLMPFRFGFPTEQPGAPGPRRSLDEVLIA